MTVLLGTGRTDTVNVLPVIYFPVVTPVHFANGYPQKKGVNPNIGHRQEIKYVKDVSCVDHLSPVKNCHKYPNCCTCRGQITPVLEKNGHP